MPDVSPYSAPERPRVRAATGSPQAQLRQIRAAEPGSVWTAMNTLPELGTLTVAMLVISVRQYCIDHDLLLEIAAIPGSVGSQHLSYAVGGMAQDLEPLLTTLAKTDFSDVLIRPARRTRRASA